MRLKETRGKKVVTNGKSRELSGETAKKDEKR